VPVRAFLPLLSAVVLAATACTDRLRPSPPPRAGVVDSALPVPELLRRFKAELPDTTPITAFADAAPSRDSLVARFVAALNARDTAAFRAMMLSRAEFAWLYYADHPLSKPPYEMPPWLMWQRAVTLSDNGLGTALAEYGGRRLRLERVTCPDSTPQVSGPLTLWNFCVTRMRSPAGETIEHRFFGTMVGRDGRWKFVSYSSDL
jgi:hypothetical protein